ncbi:EscU/YscU/HrcU family type III secretion system export apparatus switch protein [Paracoccus ravus]|uniref:EscU/YscU/HrcU family type III secretion system export apparatus switch protein n=1 Tax=Paracoccus ravus TaxID=2447760 RepID=UPI00106E16B5|nr:flagellar type III secretion system protein FlhB [Paracoccus ravus]
MSEKNDESQTEAPTEQKLRKARRKGDVAITKEAGTLLSFCALLVLIGLVARFELPALLAQLAQTISAAPGAVISAEINGAGDLLTPLTAVLIATVVFTVKALSVFLLAALIGGLAQGSFVVSRERINPKFSKLNPLQGAARLVGAQNLVEFGKNLVKLVVVMSVTLWLAWQLISGMLPGAEILPERLFAVIGGQAKQMLIWICALMVPVMLADLSWKRFSYIKKQKMSRKEVRDEHKDSEGDPHIRSKRQQIRRDRARSRMSQAVPTATLVVTNPTHYAVALRYERGVDPAPICVAKGADLTAARIRAIAHAHEVPVIESVAVARALYAVAKVDEAIPEADWPAVAELVGYVFDLRRKIRRPAPKNASLRVD